jgi:hypothetical protein
MRFRKSWHNRSLKAARPLWESRALNSRLLISLQFAAVGREQAERSSGKAAKQAADDETDSTRLLVTDPYFDNIQG